MYIQLLCVFRFFELHPILFSKIQFLTNNSKEQILTIYVLVIKTRILFLHHFEKIAK